MKKNFGYILSGAVIVLIASIFWAFSLAMPDRFEGFTLAWTVLIISGGIGVVLILQAILAESMVQVKKLRIILGCCLIVCALICLVSALALPGSLVIPIIVIVATLGVIISLFVLKDKEKWDEGDNHKEGYKNYHERKKEEEEAKAQNEENK